MIRAPEQMAYFPSSCSDSDDDLESDQDDEEDEDNDEDYDDEIDETAEKRYLAWASVDNYWLPHFIIFNPALPSSRQ